MRLASWSLTIAVPKAMAARFFQPQSLGRQLPTRRLNPARTAPDQQSAGGPARRLEFFRLNKRFLVTNGGNPALGIHYRPTHGQRAKIKMRKLAMHREDPYSRHLTQAAPSCELNFCSLVCH